MFVCICNSIKESHISAILSEGVDSIADVYRRCGCQPQCGKCVPFVLEQFKSACREDA